MSSLLFYLIYGKIMLKEREFVNKKEALGC